jgi:hypothetical protein
MARKARIENANPSRVAAWSGAWEKLVIASKAKRTMRAGVNLVRPPSRAARR